MSKKVFLGGACGTTTWREEIIPELEKHGIDYYNPQVKEWSEELIEIEAKAKEDADILLFVISKETRSIASMIEAAEYIAKGREILLVIENIDDGQEIAGQKITGQELKDLNRARKYLCDVALRNDCLFISTFNKNAIIGHIKFLPKKPYSHSTMLDIW